MDLSIEFTYNLHPLENHQVYISILIQRPENGMLFKHSGFLMQGLDSLYLL